MTLIEDGTATENGEAAEYSVRDTVFSSLSEKEKIPVPEIFSRFPDLVRVFHDSYTYLAPVIACFLSQDVLNRESDATHIYCPVRSGEIFAFAGNALGMNQFTSEVFPRSIQRMPPSIGYIPPGIHEWYTKTDASDAVRDFRVPITIIDWGAYGSLPNGLTAIRRYEYERTLHHSMPEKYAIRGRFLFAGICSSCSSFFPRLPEARVIRESREYLDEETATNVACAEIFHDLLRGSMGERHDEHGHTRTIFSRETSDWKRMRNFVAEKTVLAWCQTNRNAASHLSKDAVIQKVFDWTYNLPLVEYEQYTDG